MNDLNNCFIERRTEKERMIPTHVEPIFVPNSSFKGTISELHSGGLKINMEQNFNESIQMEQLLEKHFLVSFQFNKNHRPVVVPAATIHLDESSQAGANMVFRFYNMENKHSEIIKDIIDLYGERGSHKTR